MADTDTHIEFEGVVDSESAGGFFKVILDGQDKPILAQLSGRMRNNRIRVIVGDRVKVRFSTYDTTRGQITFRHR